MTINDLIKPVRYKLGLSSDAVAEATIKAVRDAIVEQIEAGANIPNSELAIYGLGKFRTIKVAEKMGRNPQTGEKKLIPARTKIKFVPTKTIADLGK